MRGCGGHDALVEGRGVLVGRGDLRGRGTSQGRSDLRGQGRRGRRGVGRRGAGLGLDGARGRGAGGSLGGEPSPPLLRLVHTCDAPLLLLGRRQPPVLRRLPRTRSPV